MINKIFTKKIILRLIKNKKRRITKNKIKKKKKILLQGVSISENFEFLR
jgi:hypothetical protein